MENNVKKTDYGYELSWANQETYTGKILVFENLNARTDLFFHKHRNKSLFVNNGKFKIRYVNTENGEILETELEEGHTFNVPALMPIQICSLGVSGSISEVSDKPDDEDIYVCLKSSYLG